MHIVSVMTSPPTLPSGGFPGDTRGWTPQLWAILVVLGGALCLDALDVSMVGVALPSIRTSLGLSTSSLQWIVSGYVLGYGGSCSSAAGPPTCSAADVCSSWPWPSSLSSRCSEGWSAALAC